MLAVVGLLGKQLHSGMDAKEADEEANIVTF